MAETSASPVFDPLESFIASSSGPTSSLPAAQAHPDVSLVTATEPTDSRDESKVLRDVVARLDRAEGTTRATSSVSAARTQVLRAALEV